MTASDYFTALAEQVESVIEAEAKLRELARLAPTPESREETLAEADSLSSSKRRLRSLSIRGREKDDDGRPRPITDTIQIGDLRIDPASREVTVAGRSVHLSAKEYGVLRVLASEPMRVFTKQELMREVWRAPDGLRTRTLDSHVARIRGKLDPERRRWVVNCWGVGYRLVDELPEGVAA